MGLYSVFDIWCQSANTSLPFLEMFNLRHRLACCCRGLSSARNANQEGGAFFWFFTSDESVTTSDESSSESDDGDFNERRKLNFCSTTYEIENAAMQHFYDEHPTEFLRNVRRTLSTLEADIPALRESYAFPGATVGVSVRPLGFTTQVKSDWVDGVPVHSTCIPAMEICYQSYSRIYRRRWIALVAGYIRAPMLLSVLQAAVAKRLYVQGVQRKRWAVCIDDVTVYADWWMHVFTWTNAYRLLTRK